MGDVKNIYDYLNMAEKLEKEAQKYRRESINAYIEGRKEYASDLEKKAYEVIQKAWEYRILFYEMKNNQRMQAITEARNNPNVLAAVSNAARSVFSRVEQDKRDEKRAQESNAWKICINIMNQNQINLKQLEKMIEICGIFGDTNLKGIISKLSDKKNKVEENKDKLESIIKKLKEIFVKRSIETNDLLAKLMSNSNSAALEEWISDQTDLQVIVSSKETLQKMIEKGDLNNKKYEDILNKLNEKEKIMRESITNSCKDLNQELNHIEKLNRILANNQKLMQCINRLREITNSAPRKLENTGNNKDKSYSVLGNDEVVEQQEEINSIMGTINKEVGNLNKEAIKIIRKEWEMLSQSFPKYSEQVMQKIDERENELKEEEKRRKEAEQKEKSKKSVANLSSSINEIIRVLNESRNVTFTRDEEFMTQEQLDELERIKKERDEAYKKSELSHAESIVARIPVGGFIYYLASKPRRTKNSALSYEKELEAEKYREARKKEAEESKKSEAKSFLEGKALDLDRLLKIVESEATVDDVKDLYTKICKLLNTHKNGEELKNDYDIMYYGMMRKVQKELGSIVKKKVQEENRSNILQPQTENTMKKTTTSSIDGNEFLGSNIGLRDFADDILQRGIDSEESQAAYNHENQLTYSKSNNKVI